MPFEAGSHRLLPALLSTKPLPAESVVCLVLHPPADLFFYWQEGRLCLAGNSSCVDMADGLSEGRDGILVRFRGWDRSSDCDLGRGI